jgi:hypothetical protein
VANFRTAKVTGEDLLQLTPKNTGENLGLKDETAVMRVVAAVMPLINEWKAARQAAGLSTKLGPTPKQRPKRLVADLHVMLYGAAALPPGATGAYVLLEIGKHVAKSAFVPAAGGGGYGYGYNQLGDTGMLSYDGGWPSQNSGFVMRPSDDDYALWPANDGWNSGGAWPQTFKLTIDEATAKDASSLLLDVIAWFPQVGELSIGRITIPLPDKDAPSMRLRHSQPLRVELHWKAYGEPSSPGADAWEPEAEPVSPYGYPGYGNW